MSFRTMFATVAAAGFLTSGVFAQETQQDQPPQTQPETQPETQLPQVKLLSQGAEPYHSLRLTPKAGLTQEVAMVTKTEAVTTMNGMQMQSPTMPDIKMMTTVAVDEVREGGDIVMTMTIDEVSAVGGAMPPDAEGMLTSMEGTKLAGVMTNRGQVRESKVQAAGGVNPEMTGELENLRQSLLQMSAAFPEEEVGVGATWEVKEEITSQGLTVQQATTYEIVDISDGVVKLKIAQTQHAEQQEVPGPAGSTVTIEKLEGTGSGTLTLNLTHLIATTGEATADVDMAMTLENQQMPMQVEQQMSTETTVTSQVGERTDGDDGDDGDE